MSIKLPVRVEYDNDGSALVLDREGEELCCLVMPSDAELIRDAINHYGKET